MICDWESEDLELSQETLKLLKEVLTENPLDRVKGKRLDMSCFQENWQLSQFWYSQETCQILREEVLDQTTEHDTIACISCPSAFFALSEPTMDTSHRSIRLFEYDTRFSVLGPDRFSFYDFNHPLALTSDLHASFDFILVDPPFLSDDCWSKTAQTVSWLAKPGAKILCCTGATMALKLKQDLNCFETDFDPQHAGGLANEFRSYINYPSRHFSLRKDSLF